jgi:membrane-associated phospholipid phosphatase
MFVRRREGSALARIVLVGLGFGLAFGLVYYVTVRTLQGRLFGDASLRGALLTRSVLGEGADTILDVVSVASLLAAVALVAMVALVRLARVQGLAAVGLLVGANLSTLVLKSHLLPRPDFGIREVSPATLNSLPSGHVTAVFSAVAALMLVLPPRWRQPVALVGLGAATFTALATMSAGWHRAGDAMAAFLVVGVWTAVAAGAVLVGHDSHSADPDTAPLIWPRSARWLAVVSAGSVLLGLTLGGALNAAGSVRDAAVGSGFAFLVSGLLIAGTGTAVLLGLFYVLALVDSSVSVAADRQPRP